MKDIWLKGIQGALAAAAAMCILTTAYAQPAPPIDVVLQDLASPDRLTRAQGLSALLAQSGGEAGGGNARRVSVIQLLHAHPEQAERIKTALITALEKLGEEYEAAMRANQQLDESFGEYSMALTDAVAALQDPRAVKGLLSIGGIEGVADICPVAVDAIIERSHAPELFWQGVSLHTNAFAVRTLGLCLQRPAMMRAKPEVASKIRRELLAHLDSPDSTVRIVAAEVLSPLRADPEVQAKLQAVATADPHFGLDGATKDRVTFRVRETAAAALSPSDALSFYVTRTLDTRACRVQHASETLVAEPFIGPETRDMMKRTMCSHYDPTGQDPSLCWIVEPANACAP